MTIMSPRSGAPIVHISKGNDSNIWLPYLASQLQTCYCTELSDLNEV